MTADELRLRDEKRKAREQRKAEQAQKQEERKKLEEERRRQAQEKREAEEKRRQEARQKKEAEVRKKAEKRRQEQENQKLREERNARYRYYDYPAILNSMSIPDGVLEKGKQLAEQNLLTVEQVSALFDRTNGEPAGEIRASATVRRNVFPVQIIFSRNKVLQRSCDCPECRRDYSRIYGKYCTCEYLAAAMWKLKEYLDAHTLNDATDYRGSQLLSSFRSMRGTAAIPGETDGEGSMQLVPRMIQKNGTLRLSFKVGTDKLFVIKDLKEFCRHVRVGDNVVYGSKTELNHNLSNFSEEGRRWFQFLSRIEQDDRQQQWINSEEGTYEVDTALKNTVPLVGWRLDDFYRELGNQAVDYEDRDGENIKKLAVTCGKGVPKGEMTIRVCQINSEKNSDAVFHGITVRGTLPKLYFGAEAVYYMDENHFCRADDSFRLALRPLEWLGGELSEISFRVGRNHLSDFYYKMYPELEKIYTISEEQSEKVRIYLPPQAQFRFYLDVEGNTVLCRPKVHYEEKEYSLLDILRKKQEEFVELQRDADAETEAFFHLQKWIPYIDKAQDLMFIDGEEQEEQMLRMLESGADDLMQLGEVFATQSFRHKQDIRVISLSVGVSVSGGLLDLDITTEDVSRQELLDMLGAYRRKKKYYRLKNGSYVNMDSSAMAMLAELTDAMHILPKDFLKGKLHIPVYRTLYLDQMLEEHNDVYNRRDVHFRRIVKSFKTVSEADFEVPESLVKIMRGYQKNGYQWLRTLDSWGFGGILADDMGLGKTLQIISVLLASKLEQMPGEGSANLSLIVTPASLVFNWGEELRRFAPQLNVRLVTGTQGERQSLLEEIEACLQGRRQEPEMPDVLVTSYDLLKRDAAYYENISFRYQIIDEAQYIKNHTTAAAKAVKVIHSQTRYALTGTPIENRLSELWSIFDYLMPGFLYTYEAFRREIETPVVKGQNEDAMKRLQKMTGPFILRRLKGQVLKDLPDKLEENYYVNFEGDQRKLYDAQLTHIKEILTNQDDSEFNRSRMQLLAEITRLRQVCCDPSLCFENYRGDAAKSDTCLELVKSAVDGGHRILLFSQFTSMLAILSKRLNEEKISHYTITGDTPKEERLRLVKQFNEGDTPLFLISLKAGGVGLNLTGADVVIHYDPWWNVAAQNQATDRAHRIGQTRTVIVYRLIAKDTIEEKIQELQEKKRSLAEQVIGGEGARLGSMSREELLELLEV